MSQSRSSVLARWSNRDVVLGTLSVLGVGLAFWLLYRFYQVVFILFIAIVLAVAIRPLVDWLDNRGFLRAAAVIIVYLLLLALLVTLGLLLVPLVADQVVTLGDTVTEAYATFRQSMVDSPSRLVTRLGMQLPSGLEAAAPAESVAEEPEAALAGVAEALSYVGLAGRGIFTGIAIFVLAFYWTLEGDRIIRFWLLQVSNDVRDDVREFIGAVERKLGAYIRGLLMLAASVGGAAILAYVIIGMPYALVLGLIAGVMEMVPLVGPVLGAVPAVILALTLAPSKVLWVIIATVIIQQLEGSLLAPRVMDKAVGVNPIVTLLALVAFGSLLGFGGALLAIPLAVIVQLVLDRLLWNPEATEAEVEGERNTVGILRYEVGDLLQDIRKRVRQDEIAANEETYRIGDMIEAIAVDLDSVLSQGTPQEESAS